MLSLLKKITGCFTVQDRWIFTLLVLLLFIAANLELLGIGLIMPIIACLTNPELFNQNRYLKMCQDLISPSSPERFVLILCFSGIYRTFWLRVGIRQYYKLLRLLGISGMICYVLNCCILVWCVHAPKLVLWRYTGFFIVFALLAGGLIIVERFVIHYYESFGYRHLFLRNQGKRSTLKKVLIYGGGLWCRIYISEQFCGYNFEKDMYKIIGILDDDPALKNLNVYGFEVLGGVDSLEYIYARIKFDVIMVTSRNTRPERIDQLKTFCEKYNVRLQRFVCQTQDV